MKKIFIGILCIASIQMNAQFSLTGNVSDESGNPLPYSVVSIKESFLNAYTNSNGEFKFENIKNETCVLITHCLGYKEKLDTLNLSTTKDFQIQLQLSSNNLDEVTVNSTRVNNNQGMAYSNVDAQTIQKQNLGQDAPYMLGQLTGVVVNSDAGNGVGYTGIRIRGSDGTRINVTINGVPVNDAESQGAYYVDMPDLISSVNNIQVQRGVGASNNGAGAFGASINFQTNQLKEKPYANLISSGGSFNTLRTTMAAGTGLINNKFAIDARASKITSDGYIDRAKSNLSSYYFSAGYYGKKSVLKFINFSGAEKTYQSWNYVIEDSIKKGNRTYNSCGEYIDKDGKTKYYKNETDNYKQNNFQLHFIHQFNKRLTLNTTAHYTKGAGYYEQYKQNQSYSAYGLNDIISGKGDTISTTNLIRQLWLDNDFAGGIFNLNYTLNSKLNFVWGGSYNSYFGKHFNNIIWAQNSSNSEINYQYMMNTANKNMASSYLKMNWKIQEKLNLFVDVQAKQIDYKFLGVNDKGDDQIQNKSFTFFNPKMGLSYNANEKINFYSSVSTANKEPNRDDFVQSSINNRPKAEQLIDVEAGIKFLGNNFQFNTNLYYMDYKNQLVLNGQINSVGAYNRINVDKSFREGIEVELLYKLKKYLVFNANCALSQNKVLNFKEYIDDYDNGGQIQKPARTTDIAFSPNVVASQVITLIPFKNFECSFIVKEVSRQYLDNTSNINRSIKPYAPVDFRINYLLKTKLIPEIHFMLSAFNLFDIKYSTNGYTYSYSSSSQITSQNWLAPAAGRNFLFGLNLKIQ